MIPYQDSHQAHIRPTRCHPAIIRRHLASMYDPVRKCNALYCCVQGIMWYHMMSHTLLYNVLYHNIWHIIWYHTTHSMVSIWLIIWCPYDSSYGTTQHIIVQSHRTHHTVPYDASYGTVWCIKRYHMTHHHTVLYGVPYHMMDLYDALYDTVQVVIWNHTSCHMVPYGTSYSTRAP